MFTVIDLSPSVSLTIVEGKIVTLALSSSSSRITAFIVSDTKSLTLGDFETATTP